ncbi:MAG: hypothetical protein P0Y56_14525 [Candidatus Andeanibacterium colombiense]|uniref:Uncharacterized protein n=1 Tax=Candidatus Andeanibacterium colombiense TaxID=3121345 RepID=A0AAJ5X5C5_9SPHN|nr:MAG: hypothetical protein P0Y56_14525 [Sphingomonadaceae bacterium]
MIWIALALATCGICSVIVVRALARAPYGHQDESGFTYGERGRPHVRALERPVPAAEPVATFPTREERPRMTERRG